MKPAGILILLSRCSILISMSTIGRRINFFVYDGGKTVEYLYFIKMLARNSGAELYKTQHFPFPFPVPLKRLLLKCRRQRQRFYSLEKKPPIYFHVLALKFCLTPGPLQWFYC